MPRPLLLLAAAIPLLLSAAAPNDPEPAFGVACGTGLSGKPREVILHAGLESASPIHLAIRDIPLDPATPDDPQIRLEVTAGGNNASCSTDTASPFHVYLNTRNTAEVRLAIHSSHPILIRGLRNGREQGSVTIEPTGPVAAALTW